MKENTSYAANNESIGIRQPSPYFFFGIKMQDEEAIL
jgi:hypothetical protein